MKKLRLKTEVDNQHRTREMSVNYTVIRNFSNLIVRAVVVGVAATAYNYR